MSDKRHTPHGILGILDEGQHDQTKRSILDDARDSEEGERRLPRPEKSPPKQWRQHQRLPQQMEARSCGATGGEMEKESRRVIGGRSRWKGKVRKVPCKEKKHAIKQRVEERNPEFHRSEKYTFANNTGSLDFFISQPLQQNAAIPSIHCIVCTNTHQSLQVRSHGVSAKCVCTKL